jgi:protein gp37
VQRRPGVLQEDCMSERSCFTMAKTRIEWCDRVWNPTVGCTPVSAGCKNCYAKRIYERFHPGQSFNQVHTIPGRLDDPLHWRKPARVFVDSMSDLFHPDVPYSFIEQVLARMSSADQHTYMILTKRPEKMMEFINGYRERGGWWRGDKVWFGTWPLPNVWLGVSVEDQKTADERIPLLLQTPAAVRFVSYEPALGPVDLGFKRPCPGASWEWSETGKREYCSKCGNWHYEHPAGISWVIMGCESGPGRRPMNLDWARSMRDQCQAAGVPFFLKQAEVDGKLIKMPALHGKVWAEYLEASQ